MEEKKYFPSELRKVCVNAILIVLFCSKKFQIPNFDEKEFKQNLEIFSSPAHNNYIKVENRRFIENQVIQYLQTIQEWIGSLKEDELSKSFLLTESEAKFTKFIQHSQLKDDVWKELQNLGAWKSFLSLDNKICVYGTMEKKEFQSEVEKFNKDLLDCIEYKQSEPEEIKFDCLHSGCKAHKDIINPLYFTFPEECKKDFLKESSFGTYL